MRRWKPRFTATNLGVGIGLLFLLSWCNTASRLFSYEQFTAIKCGDSLGYVETILEEKGVVQSSSTIPDGFGGSYSMQSILFGDGNISYIQVDFTDGAVSSKLGDHLVGSPDGGSAYELCPVEVSPPEP
jgi:hypothetical protein